MVKNWKLQALLLLSIVGFLISLYLVQNHYAGAAAGSFCDFGETISCSLVNNSVYSELFHVPVALFGALWFVILFSLSWKARKGEEPILAIQFLWSILGFLFVLYMIYAEIVLQAICPLCTVLHSIIILTIILSYHLYRHHQVPFSQLQKAAVPWFFFAAILFGLPIIFLNLGNMGSEDNQQYDAIAQCLTDKGLVMYGSFRCGVCAKTREMFGDSVQYIKEVECHPQGPGSEWQLCQLKGISGTPTWIMEPDGNEIKRHTGFLSLEELQQFAGGC